MKYLNISLELESPNDRMDVIEQISGKWSIKAWMMSETPVYVQERKSVEPASVNTHSHYKKDVSHLKFIDPYRISQLYGINNAALDHAFKKIIMAGDRGAKDWAQDVQEAIDSLQRALEMAREDEMVNKGGN